MGGQLAISWSLDSDPGSIYFLFLAFYGNWKNRGRRNCVTVSSRSWRILSRDEKANIHIVRRSGCWWVKTKEAVNKESPLKDLLVETRRRESRESSDSLEKYFLYREKRSPRDQGIQKKDRSDDFFLFPRVPRLSSAFHSQTCDSRPVYHSELTFLTYINFIILLCSHNTAQIFIIVFPTWLQFKNRLRNVANTFDTVK